VYRPRETGVRSETVVNGKDTRVEVFREGDGDESVSCGGRSIVCA